MSPTPTRLPRAKSVETYLPERRLHQRYPIALDAEYTLFSHPGRIQSKGSCRTINIGSDGVLLAVNDGLPILSSIELSIKWPCFLEGAIPLRLIARGRVVWNNGESIEVEFLQHDFYTASTRC
jgi:hypothetical protein